MDQTIASKVVATEPDPTSPTAEVGPGAAKRDARVYRPTLDVVRFLAAVCVMLSHAGAIGGGGHAVAVFFVLSGFLIGGQLVAEKGATGRIRLPEFYFKRVTRIWVPYYVVLFFMIALFTARGQSATPDFHERMFGALTYTYNLFNAARGDIQPTWVTHNHIWSLSIEEQFYLVAPLLVGFVPPWGVAPACLSLAVAAMCFAPLYAGLFMGVLMASVAIRRRVLLSELPRWAVPPAASACAAACAGLFVAAQYRWIRQDDLATYLLGCVIVLSANYVPLPKRWHGPLRYLGLMTYSYYLIHGLPGYFLGAVYRKVAGVAQTPVWFNVVVGLAGLGLSYAFVRWIELPVLRVRTRLLKERSPLVGYAPFAAWSVSLIGIAGLIYAVMR